MSMSSILRAVRNTLRTKLEIGERECDVRAYPGMPPRWAGEWFYAVCPTNWGPSGSADWGIREGYRVDVVITRRVSAFPHDRWMGELLLDQSESIERAAREVLLTVHLNYDILELANDQITSDTYKIHTPLQWSGGSPLPELKDAAWFQSDSPAPPAVCGLVIDLAFGEAERSQSSDDWK